MLVRLIIPIAILVGLFGGGLSLAAEADETSVSQEINKKILTLREAASQYAILATVLDAQGRKVESASMQTNIEAVTRIADTLQATQLAATESDSVASRQGEIASLFASAFIDGALSATNPTLSEELNKLQISVNKVTDEPSVKKQYDGIRDGVIVPSTGRVATDSFVDAAKKVIDKSSATPVIAFAGMLILAVFVWDIFRRGWGAFAWPSMPVESPPSELRELADFVESIEEQRRQNEISVTELLAELRERRQAESDVTEEQGEEGRDEVAEIPDIIKPGRKVILD